MTRAIRRRVRRARARQRARPALLSLSGIKGLRFAQRGAVGGPSRVAEGSARPGEGEDEGLLVLGCADARNRVKVGMQGGRLNRRESGGQARAEDGFALFGVQGRVRARDCVMCEGDGRKRLLAQCSVCLAQPQADAGPYPRGCQLSSSTASACMYWMYDTQGDTDGANTTSGESLYTRSSPPQRRLLRRRAHPRRRHCSPPQHISASVPDIK
jgi:hypothetical protein